MTIDLDAYLKRINFRDKLKPNKATLTALMRSHVLAVPFENLDIQLGVPVTTVPEDAYTKIVDRGRGGWCFEQNGLFKWVLTEIGFDVHSLAGFVGRVENYPLEKAGHLFLQVNCDEALLVDVGFGGSLLEPIPLGPCRIEQHPYTLSVNSVDGEFFRWVEQAHSQSSSFDFSLFPTGPGFFDAISHWLQSDQTSPFVQTLTTQQRYLDKHVVLRGLVKRTIDANGVSDEVLQSCEQLMACLTSEFQLDVPDVVKCWEKLVVRHKELIGG